MLKTEKAGLDIALDSKIEKKKKQKQTFLKMGISALSKLSNKNVWLYILSLLTETSDMSLTLHALYRNIDFF